MKKLTPAVIDAALLKSLHAKTPAKQRDMWANTRGNPRKFKDTLTAQLRIIQSRRCAYCGMRLFEESPARDHIAPKESHPEFTFISANLVLACFHCNTESKWTTDTVVAKAATYENCTFSIIHPYFDEPGDHIQFVGGDNELLVQVVNGSQKGLATVNLFALTSPELTKQRAKDAIYDDDVEHLPGPWRDALLRVAEIPLRGKWRPA
jgi:uncharacterized protein (TIGR02646 family)